MSYQLVLAPVARADIVDALAWSLGTFGPSVQDGYEALIIATFDAISLEPMRLGSHDRSDLGVGLRSLHLRACRDAVSSGVRRIASPRHFVLYRDVENAVQIYRLLHEAMDVRVQSFAGEELN